MHMVAVHQALQRLQPGAPDIYRYMLFCLEVTYGLPVVRAELQIFQCGAGYGQLVIEVRIAGHEIAWIKITHTDLLAVVYLLVDEVPAQTEFFIAGVIYGDNALRG